MTKLHEYGYVPKTPGDVGIEIEVEFSSDAYVCSGDKVWDCKKEDSLRFQGIEFVTKEPISLGEGFKVLKPLCDNINKKPVVKDSPRTSIHVHVNVSDLTPTHIATTIAAYWSVENLLASLCGEDRESNLFCMRLKDAEGLLDLTVKSLDHFPPFHDLTDHVRYAGMNLAAIKKFGSIEFRLKGGSTDPEDINDWAVNVHNLVHSAGKFKNPEDFFEQWQAKRCNYILGELFSYSFAEKLKRLPRYRDLMEENAPLISEFAYAKDWDQWEKKLSKKMETHIKPAPKKKKTGNNPFPEGTGSWYAWNSLNQATPQVAQPMDWGAGTSITATLSDTSSNA